MTPQVSRNGSAERDRSSLKILQILDHSLPVLDGYTFRSQSIFREQRKRGWSPIAVTSPKHEASWTSPSKVEEEIDGFRHYRTGASRNSIPFVGEVSLMKSLANRIV